MLLKRSSNLSPRIRKLNEAERIAAAACGQFDQALFDVSAALFP